MMGLGWSVIADDSGDICALTYLNSQLQGTRDSLLLLETFS